jgi:GNAT superfamily N-acetyltransferase
VTEAQGQGQPPAPAPAQVRRAQVRRATAADADAVARLAAELASSFVFSRAAFDRAYPALIAAPDARLLVAVSSGPGPGSGECLGYLLGFWHLTLYANGPVGWVEELCVQPEQRGRGTGRILMAAFEAEAAERGCALVAVATRRAASFYLAAGYEESATYFRRLLDPAPGPPGQPRPM